MRSEKQATSLKEGLIRFRSNLPENTGGTTVARIEGAISAIDYLLELTGRFEMEGPCPPVFDPNKIVDEPQPMSREDAECKIMNAIKNDGTYSYVDDSVARTMLGETIFARMKADPVRGRGPREGTVYPWNLVDYLSSNLGRTKQA